MDQGEKAQENYTDVHNAHCPSKKMKMNSGKLLDTNSAKSSGLKGGRPKLRSDIGGINHNQLRSEIRELSKKTVHVSKSLQTCGIKYNVKLLTEHIQKLKAPYTCDSGTPDILLCHLQGLRAVLYLLLAQVPTPDGREVIHSYLKFGEAFALYLSYDKNSTSITLKSPHYRKRFRELVCHPIYGFCVYIVTCHNGEEYILLKSDDVDLEYFFEQMQSTDKNQQESRLVINRDLVQDLLSNLDTEWDKQVFHVLLGAERSRTQLQDLGIDFDAIPHETKQVLEIIQERKQAALGAEDIVQLRIKKSSDKIMKN